MKFSDLLWLSIVVGLVLIAFSFYLVNTRGTEEVVTGAVLLIVGFVFVFVPFVILSLRAHARAEREALAHAD